MQVKTSTPFVELLNNPGQAGEVTQRFEQMIMESFAVDAARKAIASGSTGQAEVKAAELKRRFNILADWFKVMRGDMGWSMSRTFDELPRALRAQLDGEIYVPDSRNMWAPKDEPATQGDQG